MAQDANDREAFKRQLDAIQSEADTAVEELRDLAHGVYPAVLYDFGLAVALRSLAAGAAIPVQVADRGIGRYRETIEAALYFCTREAIQNAAKHAGAGAKVTVTLDSNRNAIELTVEDNGVGIGPDRATSGIGIVDMRDRIEAVGGQFVIISAPGHGASIRATIPNA